LYYLDLVVDASVDEGVNGCCIRSITSTSIDNCLQIGDFILSINHENMRKISNSHACSIIQRVSLIESDIRYSSIRFLSLFRIVFILGDEAKQFKDQMLELQLIPSE
jgi:hypothetical protein